MVISFIHNISLIKISRHFYVKLLTDRLKDKSRQNLPSLAEVKMLNAKKQKGAETSLKPTKCKFNRRQQNIKTDLQ